MFCPGNDHLRIGVTYLQKWGYFPLKSFFFGNIITHLNINFFAASLCDKVDFFLIQLSYVNIISAAKQLDAYYIFIDPAIIHISAAENCITNSAVTEIKFFRVRKILFSSNIVAFNIVKYKSIAQIFNIFTDSYMICRSIIRRQQLTDLIGRRQIADIVHEKLA